MEQEYLSIKEFAMLAGVSCQSIYKRIGKENNPIKPYLRKVGNQFTISKSALYVLYNVKVEEIEEQPSLKVEKQPQENIKELKEETEKLRTEKSDSASLKLIEILNEQLKAERQENENKNKIIADLTEMLKESNRMLDQAQKLNALDKQTILELQEGKRIEAGSIEEKPQKQSIWQRLFGK